MPSTNWRRSKVKLTRFDLPRSLLAPVPEEKQLFASLFQSTKETLPPIPFAVLEDEQIGDFELRNITINPPSEPAVGIEVVLVTHDPTPAGESICAEMCEQFAADFDAVHLCISRYLSELYNSSMAKSEDLLGFLHPTGLEEYLQRGYMPPIFLMPILLKWVQAQVALAKRRFVISGINDYPDSAVEFAKKIAMPMALFSFREEASKDQRTHFRPGELERAQSKLKLRRYVEKEYEGIMLVVPIDKKAGKEEAYARLLAAMFEEVARV